MRTWKLVKSEAWVVMDETGREVCARLQKRDAVIDGLLMAKMQGEGVQIVGDDESKEVNDKNPS